MPNQATPNVPVSTKNASKPQSNANANEGEGSRTAARNYDNATAEYIKSGRVDSAARRAAEALDGPEGDELRKAELAARATAPAEESGAANVPQGGENELLRDAEEDGEENR